LEMFEARQERKGRLTRETHMGEVRNGKGCGARPAHKKQEREQSGPHSWQKKLGCLTSHLLEANRRRDLAESVRSGQKERYTCNVGKNGSYIT